MTNPVVQPPPAPPEPGRAVEASYALVLLGIAMFVVNAGVSRLVLNAGADPFPLASVRITGTALVLGAFLLLTGRTARLRVRRDEWPLLVVYGLAGVGLVQVSYFVAIQRLPIGLALLLEYLAPLLVALVARFLLHEHVGRLLWPALALSLTGLALALQVDTDEPLDPVGVAAGLVAALAFATYFLLGERIVRHRDPLSTTFWGFAIAGVAGTAMAPWFGTVAYAAETSAALPDVLGGATVPLLLLVAWVVLLGTLGPFAVTTAALRHVPATTVTVVSTLEPVGAAVIAWWWFDESLRAVQLVGSALVLAGIVLAMLARSRATRTAA